MTGERADALVIGGGPAGVAAAIELRRHGIGKVVLLEREPRLGGATSHCSHSPFGMREYRRVYIGAAYGRRLEREAARHGVDVRLGHAVVRMHDDGMVAITSAAKGSQAMIADRIMVATGARETPRSARLITGDRPVGVLTTGALQAYVAFHGLMPFRRPLIVGSELVAFSALLTCLTNRARPVAMIEHGPHASAPFAWFPRMTGVPFHRNAEILDIQGEGRVCAVRVRLGEREATLACDGVLLTGQFTPEAALYRQSPMAVDRGSAGPAIDQNGRLLNPIFFSAGNILRAVESGGWAFREGRAVGQAMARAGTGAGHDPGAPVIVDFADPLKLVVPQMLRPGRIDGAALRQFQLRFARRIRGELVLEIDDRVVWRRRKLWMPERRVLVPIPAAATTARTVRFLFEAD